MKRILAIVLAGVMGIGLLYTDASAGGGKKRHYRRSHVRQRYIGPGYYSPFFRPPGYYYRYRHGYRPFRPPVVYYPRHIHRNHYHPARSYSYTTTYSSGGGQILGAILGGIGGGVIGNQIGGGSGKAIATVAGSLIGVLLGSEVGRQLDERERLIMARTTTQSLESYPSGTAVPWSDPDSGTYGSVTPKPAYQNAEGDYCREYQQTVTINGETKSAYGTACRNPDGSWRLAPTR